ncbi:MAG: hypothetical protein U9Q30_02775 [Campylobacterota bacterium]|nr:hypothetical protein [Campylobacterota bacterium]
MSHIKIFTTTLSTVIKNLSNIKRCSLDNFKDEVIEAFDGYHYEDIEDVTGFEIWPDINKDGKYELNVKINHIYAYELTLTIENKNSLISVLNVL